MFGLATELITKGWFPYDRGSQIAIRSAIVCDHMIARSQKIEPCSI